MTAAPWKGLRMCRRLSIWRTLSSLSPTTTTLSLPRRRSVSVKNMMLPLVSLTPHSPPHRAPLLWCLLSQFAPLPGVCQAPTETKTPHITPESPDPQPKLTLALLRFIKILVRFFVIFLCQFVSKESLIDGLIENLIL